MTIRDVKLLFDELAKWRVQSSCSHWQKSNLPPQLPPREMVAAARFLYWYKYRTKAKILEQIEVLKLQWLCDEPMVPTEKIPAFWKGFKNTYDQTTNHLKGSMYPASTLWIEGNGVSSNDGPDFHFTDQITMAKPEKQQKTGSGNSLIELAAKDPIDCVIGDDKAQDDGKEEAAESHVDQQADQDKGKMEDDDEDREGYLLKPPEFYREMGDSIWADLEPRIEAKIQNMVDKTLQHMVNQKVNRKVERVVFDVMTRYIERRKRKREEEGDSPTAEDWDRLFSQV
ncbi:hypothetical protein NKR23_g5024 [Pleurostoma richardsiae]|uniref:Uncharacterized protein n=1 Tax=Pleurostoma richardsiae TaxID=41990 RepID=A0AA38RTR2_9PEZI|nr:hypothetical protein NKR23_g5024 [Pleurostoma richardsiae]